MNYTRVETFSAALIRALETRDSSQFAKICSSLARSNSKRKIVSKHLLQTVSVSGARQAGLAVMALSLSGMAWEDYVFDDFLAVAQDRFPKSVLSNLAKNSDAQRAELDLPDEFRLLKNIIQVLSRKQQTAKLDKVKDFMRRVRLAFKETPLGNQIKNWSHEWC